MNPLFAPLPVAPAATDEPALPAGRRQRAGARGRRRPGRRGHRGAARRRLPGARRRRWATAPRPARSSGRTRAGSVLPDQVVTLQVSNGTVPSPPDAAERPATPGGGSEHRSDGRRRMSGTTIAGTALRAAAGVTAAGALGLGYAVGVERHWFALRRARLEVLDPVTAAGRTLRVLHVSDLHLRPGQRLERRFVEGLAELEPDLVVNTGDNLSHRRAVPEVLRALGGLLDKPGVVVWGSNDYHGPKPKNPAHYLFNPQHRVLGPELPWRDLRAAFLEHGWLDATHARHTLTVDGLRLADRRRRRPAHRPRRLRPHRGPGRRAVRPAPRAHPLPRAPGARRVRRRRLRPRARRPHPRRPAAAARVRRDHHQLRRRPLPRPRRLALGRPHAPARLGGSRHLAVRPGAVLVPARGHPARARSPSRPRRSSAPATAGERGGRPPSARSGANG